MPRLVPRRSRPALIAVLALCALVGSWIAAPAGASGIPDRVVTATYSDPAGVTTGTDVTVFGQALLSATSRSDEDRVTVQGFDPRGVALAVDVSPPRSSTTTRTVSCAPLVMGIAPGTTVTVTVLAGRCPDGRVVAPWGGQVQLSFHRRPAPPHVRVGAPPEDRWAVVIGIRDYAGNTHSTVGGTGDASVVRRMLLHAGWRNDHILVLTDSRATAANVRGAFTWLAQHSGPHTFSLLHFSGHVCIASRGPCARGHTYLWSYDNRFLAEDEVRARMEQVRGHSWLDIAGCEAGAFDVHSSTRMFSGSSRASEASFENPQWKESVWTGLSWDRGYNQGLADAHGRPYHATITQMLLYAARLAPKMTAREPRGPQHPVIWGGSASWTLSAPPGG